MHLEVYGRGLFWVSSETYEGYYYLVDIEPQIDGEPGHCECEAHELRMEGPCKHLLYALRWCVYRMEVSERREDRAIAKITKMAFKLFGEYYEKRDDEENGGAG